jgi:hypothetical protein
MPAIRRRHRDLGERPVHGRSRTGAGPGRLRAFAYRIDRAEPCRHAQRGPVSQDTNKLGDATVVSRREVGADRQGVVKKQVAEGRPCCEAAVMAVMAVMAVVAVGRAGRACPATLLLECRHQERADRLPDCQHPREVAVGMRVERPEAVDWILNLACPPECPYYGDRVGA